MTIQNCSDASMDAERVSFVVPEEAQGWRLDKALSLAPEGLFAEEGLRVRRRLCERGLVLVNEKTAAPGLKLRAGQTISVLQPSQPSSAAADLFADTVRIVREDKGLCAVFKPSGLHSATLAGSSDPSLEGLLPALYPSCLPPFPRLLNRLDCPTSGLVLAALDETGERLWRRAERIGQTDKRYLAVLEEALPFSFEVGRRLDTDNRARTRVRHSDDPDRCRHTTVELLHVFQGEDLGMVSAGQICTLVGCSIRKGARHQIRAHLAAAGYPLLGDRLYGARSEVAAERGMPFFLHHGGVMLPEFQAVFPPEWLGLFPESVQQAALAWLSGRAQPTA